MWGDSRDGSWPWFTAGAGGREGRVRGPAFGPDAGIERGDEDPRRTGFPRPLAKSGLDLAIEVQNPGLSISEANPGDGRLYPVALLASGVPRGRAPRRPLILIRFPRDLPGPKPSKSPLGLDPAPRSLRSENPPVASGQRAGPVRFEPRVSPDFRAAVSLGLLTFAPNPLDGKRPNLAGCAEPPRARWTTLCISVGGPNWLSRISGLCCPQKRAEHGAFRRSSGG